MLEVQDIETNGWRWLVNVPSVHIMYTLTTTTGHYHHTGSDHHHTGHYTLTTTTWVLFSIIRRTFGAVVIYNFVTLDFVPPIIVSITSEEQQKKEFPSSCSSEVT